jgi:hypothetical protein
MRVDEIATAASVFSFVHNGSVLKIKPRFSLYANDFGPSDLPLLHLGRVPRRSLGLRDIVVWFIQPDGNAAAVDITGNLVAVSAPLFSVFSNDQLYTYFVY